MTTEWTHAQQARLNDVNLHRASLLMQADALLKEAQDLTKARNEALSAQLNALHIFVQRHSLSRENDSSLISNKLAALATELRTLLAPFDPTHKPAAPTFVRANPLIPLARDLFHELTQTQRLISLMFKFIPGSDERIFKNTSSGSGIGTTADPLRETERKAVIQRAETFFASEKQQ